MGGDQTIPLVENQREQTDLPGPTRPRPRNDTNAIVDPQHGILKFDPRTRLPTRIHHCSPGSPYKDFSEAVDSPTDRDFPQEPVAVAVPEFYLIWHNPSIASDCGSTHSHPAQR